MANKQNIPVALLQCNEGQIEGLPRNPRFIKDERFKKLVKSLEDDPEMLDLREVIVYPHGKKFVAIGGNMRIRAGKELGFETIPCKILPVDTPLEKLKRIAEKDNISFGSWDYDLLANEWDTEFLEDCGFDFGTFYDSEAEGGADNAESKGAEAKAEEDNFDEDTEPIVCRCKRGEVWQLGEHRVMCGDSTSAEDVEKLRGGVLADMVFTDPPYGMGLDTDYSSMRSKLGRIEGLQGKKYERAEVDNFSPSMISSILNHFETAKEIFVWGADYFAELLPNKNNGSWFVWDKRSNNNDNVEADESSDKMFGSCFELCWSREKHKREIARVKWAGIFGLSQEVDKKRWHPTQKPIALVSWFLCKFSKPFEVVVDLFGGSGSTLIACEQLNRKCLMMELDPHYCDVILARWEKLTGQTAVKIAD